MIDWNQVVPTASTALFSGAALPVVLAWLAHNSKKIKFHIHWGEENGKTVITADALKVNCKELHGPILEQMEKIYNRQSTVLEEISGMRGYLEGRLGKSKK